VRRTRLGLISFWMCGGATSAGLESSGPADEFLVTVVGPLTTLGIGASFLLGHVLGRGSLPRPIWLGVFGLMAYANVVMGLLNLLPGFPLDGGRLLPSALWRGPGGPPRAPRERSPAGRAGGALTRAGRPRVGGPGGR